MSTKTLGAAGAVIVIAIVAVVALLSGGDDEAQASDIDGAFVAEMKPHHESAIEMAEIAQERFQHPEIEALAGEIIASQSEEINALDSIHERLFGEPIGEISHGSMGMSEEEMGAEMDAGALETAEPFDREFIDMMVPHHQSAILMARIELAEGEDEEAKSLATAIIEAQSSEIEQMNEWRTDWYGGPSPAGGVPEEGESLAPAGHESGGATEGMEH